MTRRAAENQSVNRYLDDKAMDHIDHALGRPVRPLRESYRDYFATGVNSDLAKAFDASPHWTLRNIAGDVAYYTVTRAGRAALSEYLARQGKAARAYIVTFGGHSTVVAAKSHGAARYSLFMDIRDCMPDLKFADFARGSTVRVAP